MWAPQLECQVAKVMFRVSGIQQPCGVAINILVGLIHSLGISHCASILVPVSKRLSVTSGNCQVKMLVDDDNS